MTRSYELYLIRHGLAEDHSDAWPDDSKRPLTEEGMARLRKIARSLARLDVSLDVVLTSPLVRTRQTAEIIAAAFEPRPALVAVEALAPGGNQQAVLAELEKQTRKTRIGLVGHEPGIGELAAKLIGLRHPLEFKKGAVCRIDLSALPATGPASLRWFATPGILRNLRG
jgi:phosphohistidine phosphatase